MSLIWSGLADAGVFAGLGVCLVLGPGVWAGLVMTMTMIIMILIMTRPTVLHCQAPYTRL